MINKTFILLRKRDKINHKSARVDVNPTINKKNIKMNKNSQ